MAVAIGRMEERYEAQQGSCEVNNKHVHLLFLIGGLMERQAKLRSFYRLKIETNNNDRHD